MKTIKVFLFFIFIIAFFQANAQILNVERVRLNPDSTKYITGNISANFSLFNRTAAEDAPIEFVGINSQLNLAYVAQKNLFLLLGRHDYLKINDDPFNNFGFAHFRINFKHQNRFSPEVYSQYQFDLLRGLDNRFLGGAGVRYTIVKNPQKISMSYGVGAMYEKEQWQLVGAADSLQRTTYLWKASQYANFSYQLSKNANFHLTCYHQFGYDADFDLVRHRINGDVQLLFTIIKNLQFVVHFTGAYETEPVVPITKFTYNISNGIQYNF